MKPHQATAMLIWISQCTRFDEGDQRLFIVCERIVSEYISVIEMARFKHIAAKMFIVSVSQRLQPP